MKFQFKQQGFQVQAINAVVDVFQGQALKTNRFTSERSRELIQKAKEVADKNLRRFESEVMETIGYRNVLLQITEDQILKNIKEVQRCNDLKQSERIERVAGAKEGLNLTVEMETGTGKTYTYIRTMYELHSHYGWSKFIVIVPGIAIREGVYKSFQVTQEHFQELYGHKINPFIYNSVRPQDIENFASDSRISVMIINTQAFSSPQYIKGTDKLKENAGNRIYRELDRFGSRKPVEIIAQTNPILIIDEPQSVDGDRTLIQMQNFEPLFSLRYSATHKVEYNKVYRLDALDAYNKQLVKKIQVKGVNPRGSTGTTGYLYFEQIRLSQNKAPEAMIEIEVRQGDGVKKKRTVAREGDSLFSLSGGLPVYENKTIWNINGNTGSIEIGNEILYSGDVINQQDEHTFRRIQIRETIFSHLQKEKILFDKGVKVLSLFFIDEVAKYRLYDENGEQQPGEYARIFQEEYTAACNRFIDLFHQEYNKYTDADPSKIHRAYIPSDYENYLRRDNAERVHEGYFSIDKKGKAIDSAVKRGSEDSDDISAYELIMKDKERLLSFDEPVRFIFSHSALKEGWDNPNVFQICALKNPEAGSQTRRRQEVGRGMRLCVDKNGVRQDFELIGEQVHELNRLTVVASESYEQFAKGLQSEIAATLKERPQKAEVAYFVGKLLRNEKKEEHRISQDDANRLNKILYKHDIIDDDDKITAHGRELIEQNKMPLPEMLEPFRNDVQCLLQSIYSEGVIKFENERDTVILATNDNFARKEFRELWNKISLKTVYEVKFGADKLIADSVDKINAALVISERIYQIKTGELHSNATVEKMKSGTAITETEIKNERVCADLYADTFYDIVGEIEQRTNLKRSTIVEILKKISPAKFICIHKNPEEFIAKVSRLINEVKASLIIND